MKVIRKGKSKWVDNVTCSCCEAILEITPEDITYKVTEEAARKHQYELEIEGEYFITCVECNEPIRLKKLPETVKKEVRGNQ